jgi:hypothetical protein
VYLGRGWIRQKREAPKIAPPMPTGTLFMIEESVQNSAG